MAKRVNALIIVAHPDDEIIWIGGMILKNKSWNWTILSLCRKNDDDRMPKFFKVCKILNAKGFIDNLEDEKLIPISEEEIIDRILFIIKNKKYDYIFTHGENGEYGHIRHIEVHNVVKKIVNDRKLFFFNYNKGNNVPYPNLIPPSPINDSDLFIELNDKELIEKKRIVKEIYGYPNEKGFELMSCNRKESFLEWKF